MPTGRIGSIVMIMSLMPPLAVCWCRRSRRRPVRRYEVLERTEVIEGTKIGTKKGFLFLNSRPAPPENDAGGATQTF
jgi:hypothetical protein